MANNIENTTAGIIAINSPVHVNNMTVTSTAPQHNPKKNLDFHLLKPVKSFHGRGEELEQLNTWLFSEDQRLAVVSGLPGYGKTELARHVAQRCRAEARVRSVLWLDADSPEVLEQSFRELLRWLGAGAEADLDARRSVVQAVHQRFSAEHHLFVFDNAPDRRSVAGFLSEGACRCLCTSHVQDWGDGVPVLPLEPLPMDAALDVFRTVLGQRFLEADAPLYRRLADLLSRVPLALQVAAASVRQEMLLPCQTFSLANFVEEFQKSFDSYLDADVPNFSDMPYENTIYESLRKAVRKIENRNDDIAKLSLCILHILAYLNLNHIFLSDIENFRLVNKLSNKKLNEALSLIQNFSFIRITGKKNKILIHKLVQKIIIFYQSHFTEENYNPYYIFCLEYVASVYPSKHSHAILEVINNHEASFTVFYKEYEFHITSRNAFLYNLIETGCAKILFQILNTLDRRAIDVVNARCLLHRAVRCRQHDILEELLARGARVEQQDDQGITALIVAAADLNLSAIKMLTSHNADVNALDRVGDSVLHYIVGASGLPQHVDKLAVALKALRWLVGRGACPDAVGRRGGTLVHMAALVHSPHIIPHLVNEFGLDVNAADEDQETPLHWLSGGGYGADAGRILRTAECLLQLGARLSDVDSWGDTPVDNARQYGLHYLADYLEKPTANIDIYIPQVFEFSEALSAAVAAGDVESLGRQLDELGARAAEVAGTCRLLHPAVEHAQHEALELLLERGADVDSRDDCNDTALIRAAFNLRLQCMKTLIQHGADVNAVGASGASVLHRLVLGAGAPRGADLEDEVCAMLRRLVGRGARTDAVTSQGETMLHWAALSLRATVVRCLLSECEVDVHAVDEGMNTALHWVSDGLDVWHAEEERGISTAACLLDFGARTDLLNAQGRSPAQFARVLGYKKLAAYLDGSAAGEDGRQVEDADRVRERVAVFGEGGAEAQARGARAAVRAWCQRLWARCSCCTHRQPYIVENEDDSSSDEL